MGLCLVLADQGSMKRRFFAVLHQPPVEELRPDACKAARSTSQRNHVAVSTAFHGPKGRYHTLRRMPEEVIVTSRGRASGDYRLKRLSIWRRRTRVGSS
jgi:hypothetical protein